MRYTDQLQSSRLTTRFVTQDDAKIWLEYCSDPIATTYTAIAGKTPGEMVQFGIDTTIKRYEDGRGGLQALITKDTGEFVGQCGLFIQVVNGKEELEVGYHLLRRFWGKGYATEAAQMFRDYGFEHYPVMSLVSIIDPRNVPSQKVAIRNGMHLSEREAEFRGSKYDLFRITRDEWERLKK